MSELRDEALAAHRNWYESGFPYVKMRGSPSELAFVVGAAWALERAIGVTCRKCAGGDVPIDSGGGMLWHKGKPPISRADFMCGAGHDLHDMLSALRGGGSEKP